MEWRNVFILSAEIYAFGGLFFLILSSGKQQWWGAGLRKGTPSSHIVNVKDDDGERSMESNYGFDY